MTVFIILEIKMLVLESAWMQWKTIIINNDCIHIIIVISCIKIIVEFDLGVQTNRDPLEHLK